MQFQLDGQNLGAEDSAGPYSADWDTRGEINGAHTLRAVVRDTAGTRRHLLRSTVNVSNAGVSTAGSEPPTASTTDRNGVRRRLREFQNRDSQGRRLDERRPLRRRRLPRREQRRVDPPALGTFYKTAFTFEAWVLQAVEQGRRRRGRHLERRSGRRSDDLGRSRDRALPADPRRRVRGLPRLRPLARSWPVAARGGDVRRLARRGSTSTASSRRLDVHRQRRRLECWRIGAYGSPAAGFFDGLVDNVRIYSRALTGSEVQTDMASRIQPGPDPADGQRLHTRKRRDRRQCREPRSRRSSASR